MKKLLGIAGLAVLASAAFGQANLSTRAFTFDSTQATNGMSTFEVNNTTVSSSGTAGTTTSNAVTAATAAGATFACNTTINVLTYVYFTGNLGGTFTINGPGSNVDTERDTDCEIRSNRPLKFTTAAFTVLQTGGSAASTVGSVAYALSIYTGWPYGGAQVGSTVSGTDAAFNNSTGITTAMSDLDANGKMTLRLARTLTLNQLAEGATTYTASGTIVLAIN
jgi:hypothetical protein